MTISAADILEAVDQGSWNTDLGIGSFSIDYSTGRFELPSFRMGASWMVVIAETNTCKYALRIPKLESAKNPFALEKLERMSEILEEKSINWFPDFRLVRDALQVNGELLPVLIMPFIEGYNFSQYIADNRYETEILYDLIHQLEMLENDILRDGFDHGDISVRNILIDGTGNIMLIDPDALHHTTCSLSRSPELGCSSINHPLRTPRDIGPGLCIFPIRIITMILHTIAKEPSLLQDNPDPQAFFFTESDLRNPSSSVRMKRVKRTIKKKYFRPIICALNSPSLMKATEILRPDIHKVSKPVVLFTVDEMLQLDTQPPSPPQVKQKIRHHPKMRTLSLSDEFRISNSNKKEGDGEDVE